MVHGSMQRRGFLTFLAISTLTYFAEIGLVAHGIWYLFDAGLIIWFSMSIGMLVVPLLGTQLLSIQLWCNREIATFAEVIPHLTLISIPWRYYRLLRSDKKAISRQELGEVYTIRLVHTFTASLPLLLVYTYIFMHNQTEDEFIVRGACLATATGLLISSTWTLASYSKNRCCVLSSAPPWRAIGCQSLWRLGELVARVMTLTLFAACHGYWVFLVDGLHILTMGLLLVMEYSLNSNNSSNRNRDRSKCLINILLGSYVYLFCHLVLTQQRTRAGLVLHHVIVFMESVTLLVLWVLYDDQLGALHVAFVLVVAVSYAVSVVGALISHFCLQKAPNSSTSARSSNDASLHDSNLCPFHCQNCRTRCPDGSPQPEKLREQVVSTVPVDRTRHKTSAQYLDRFLSECEGHAFDGVRNVSGRVESDNTQTSCNKPRRGHRSHRHNSSYQHPRTHHKRVTPNSPPKRPGSAPVPDAIGFSDHSDLAWDNYDLNLPTTPSVSSKGGRRRSKLVMGVGVKTMSTNGKKDEKIAGQSVDRGGCHHGDQGYFSAISSSSKENSHNELGCGDINHQMSRISKSFSCLPGHSDENCSTTTSVSARVGFLSCDKCGHSMSIDNLSVYSGQSSTTVTSSQHGRHGCEPPWPHDLSRLAKSLPQVHNRLVRRPATCRPVKKKKTIQKTKQRAHSSIPSDTSTSAAYNDYTETE